MSDYDLYGKPRRRKGRRTARYTGFSETPYPEFTGQETYVPNAAPAKRKRKRSPTSAGLFAGLNPLMSEEQLRKAALAYVNEILGAQQSQAKSAYETKAANLQAAYAALANIAKGISPAVSQAYNTGSQAISGAAQGFTGAVRGQQEQVAAEQNAVLQNLGSPQQVTSGFSTGGGDAAYAIGGYIPASTLAREGAAYSATAANLPYSTGLQGIEGTKQLGREYEDQVRELEAQRQEMLFEAINALSGRDQARYTSGRNDRLVELEYGSDVEQARAKARADAAEFTWKQRKWLAELGLKEASLSLQERRLLLDQWKASNAKTASGRPRPLTKVQRLKFQGLAAQSAEASYYGVAAEDDPNTPEDESLGFEFEPLSWEDAIFEMVKNGVPLEIGLRYLKQFYKPGERGRPNPGRLGSMRT